MAINVNGVWAIDQIYDSTLLNGALDYFRSGTGAGKLRNVQRYDGDVYADMKTIIDGLML